MIQNILQFSKWKHIKNEKISLAILPWGATEAHNLHLPYGTDTILAEYVSAEAAKAVNDGIIVLPSIAYGVNTGQMEVKLCMNMNPSTHMAILEDILEVLRKHEIKKLVIMNAHGGNLFQPIIRELSLKYPDILIASVNWWTAVNGSKYFTEPGDHAGELETACMMAIRPELVLPLSEAGKGAERKLKIVGFREKWAWIPRRWIYTSSDTGVGNPAAATAENGRKFLDECITKIASFLADFSAAGKEEDLYE